MKSEPPPIPPPSAKWVAWRKRDGNRWSKVATCQTEAEAWKRLYSAMDMERSGSWSNCVLREGVNP